MSNIVEPQIVETKPSWLSDYIKNNTGVVGGSDFSPKPYIDPKIKQQALLDAQNQIAQQQALMKEMSQMSYSGITDKIFGKQEGWSFERPMRLGAYIILGAVVGRYVAKNMKKSTTLGMVVGGLAPLLAYQLSIAYDRKNMPKQEPRQKVAMNPDGSIMTEKQIANTQFNLNCPNGTKKVEVMCAFAPCPQMEVCA